MPDLDFITLLSFLFYNLKSKEGANVSVYKIAIVYGGFSQHVFFRYHV